MTMHAVVVRQPWASLIAHGIKTIETRGFAPKSTVRPGDRLAIVAGKTKVGLFDSPAATDGWRPLMDGIGSVDARYAPLPLGVVVAVVTYDEALLILGGVPEPGEAERPFIVHDTRFGAGKDAFLSAWPESGREEAPWYWVQDQLPLGDFTPGRYGWMLSNPQRLPIPVRCRAVGPDGTRTHMQGVFRLPAAVEAAVVAQVGGES